ncbi:hypothetical protein N9J72_01030 [Candidatus Gracilibacteria bacterium]|nr:hypothetical protein [Candidatus Gracilibacteria bacterium]
MKTLSYSVEVEAPVESLWKCIVDQEKYKIWIKAFSENSYMKGKWGLGETVYFLDDNMGGTKAEITQFEEFKLIEATHTAMVTKEGTEETTGDMTEKWIGTKESYIFETTDTGSKMTLKVTTHEDFVEMFESASPKAMENIRSLCV